MLMQIDTYLARIGVSGPRDPTPAALSALHLAHLRTVPFENLDIPLGRSISLEPGHLFEKVIVRRRGGYCFELNGLFSWLLGQLGHTVTLLSARVFHGAEAGPDFEHALLLVDGPIPQIADVGFGDSYLTPLRLERDREQPQHGAAYRLRGAGADWILQQRVPGSTWTPQYAFTLAPRQLPDFLPMSGYLSTSPASPFTRKAVCSLSTSDGRVTLAGSRLIVTRHGQRVETTITTPSEYRHHLRQHFGIELDGDASIERLMALTPPSTQA